MKPEILVKPDRCIHCMSCEIACMRVHGGISRIHVESINDRFAVPLVCRHCDPAFCSLVCPSDAIFTDGKGEMRVDREKCTGCAFCEFACPFGLIVFDPDEKTAVSCDQCRNRRENGFEPACVCTCPTNAIVFQDLESYSANQRNSASLSLIRSLA